MPSGSALGEIVSVSECSLVLSPTVVAFAKTAKEINRVTRTMGCSLQLKTLGTSAGVALGGVMHSFSAWISGGTRQVPAP
jgi:hypothetical protein